MDYCERRYPHGLPKAKVTVNAGRYGSDGPLYIPDYVSLRTKIANFGYQAAMCRDLWRRYCSRHWWEGVEFLRDVNGALLLLYFVSFVTAIVGDLVDSAMLLTWPIMLCFPGPVRGAVLLTNAEMPSKGGLAYRR